MSAKPSSAINSLGGNKSWSEWFTTTIQPSLFGGMEIGKWTYMIARQVGWFIVTTGIITAFPLIFEMQREVEIEALEAQEVQEALKSGSKTPMQLAAEGKTSAVPPPVLK